MHSLQVQCSAVQPSACYAIVISSHTVSTPLLACMHFALVPYLSIGQLPETRFGQPLVQYATCSVETNATLLAQLIWKGLSR